MKLRLAALLLSLCCLEVAAATLPVEIVSEYQVTAAGVPVGRVKESFERKGDAYRIHSVTTPEGVLKLMLDDEWDLTSSGRIVAGGLRPLAFEQHRARDGKRDIEATFDWARGVMLSTYQGKVTEVALPRETQDRASVMYQFMNLERRETIEMPMTNGRKVDLYTYKLVGEPRLQTPAGTFETLHYQRVTTDPKERRAEVWLARERFNFPVRVVFEDPRGLKLEQTLLTLQVR